jgi:hypothetical protein
MNDVFSNPTRKSDVLHKNRESLLSYVSLQIASDSKLLES